MNEVLIVGPDESGYRRLQEAVTSHYAAHHGAHPRPEPDEFWCLPGPGGSVPGAACLGLSWGHRAKLFSEHYIDAAVHAERGVCRSRLVEIGQLSSFSTGAGFRLLKRVLKRLAQERDCCVLMTATDPVRRVLQSAGWRFDDLGPARASRAPDKTIEWGTYYDNNPRVLLADLRAANVGPSP